MTSNIKIKQINKDSSSCKGSSKAIDKNKIINSKMNRSMNNSMNNKMVIIIQIINKISNKCFESKYSIDILYFNVKFILFMLMFSMNCIHL